MPALQSYWLIIHVTAISFASSLLMLSGWAARCFCCAGVVDAAPCWDLLPNADSLDRMNYRIAVFAFPLYTFANSLTRQAIWTPVVVTDPSPAGHR